MLAGMCTCRYSSRNAGGKATDDVEMSEARDSWSKETRAASTPSIDVPDMMPMYSALISRQLSPNALQSSKHYFFLHRFGQDKM